MTTMNDGVIHNAAFDPRFAKLAPGGPSMAFAAATARHLKDSTLYSLPSAETMKEFWEMAKRLDQVKKARSLTYQTFFGVDDMVISTEKTLAECEVCMKSPEGPYLPIVLQNKVTFQSVSGCICLGCLKKKIASYENDLPIEADELTAVVEGMRGILDT